MPGVDKGGNVRNLGYVPKETIVNLKDIVFKGPFRDRGVPDFTGKLTEADVVKIQAFIQGTADAVRPPKKWPRGSTSRVGVLRPPVAEPVGSARSRPLTGSLSVTSPIRRPLPE